MSQATRPHLTRVKVEGFKSIKSAELEMKPINILIGANGSGKSNFISLFTFFRHLSEGKLQSYAEKNGFANAFFHFGARKTPKIHLEVNVGANAYFVDFEHGVSDDRLVFAKEYCTFQGSKKIYPVKGSQGESGLLPGSIAKSSYVAKYTREYMQQCRVYHFHDTSEVAGFKQASNLTESDYLYSNASNIASFLHRLKTSDDASYVRSYKNIISAVQMVAPFFHDFYLVPRGTSGNENVLLKWTHRNHDQPFSAHQLSDGTARFICMATLLLQPVELRPKSIVLDEPELGLHPAALEALADIVKSTARDSQVICSTQSVTFANQFSYEDFIVVDQHQGASTLRRLESTELESWLTDYSMGEIWEKNLIGGRPEW